MQCRLETLSSCSFLNVSGTWYMLRFFICAFIMFSKFGAFLPFFLQILFSVLPPLFYKNNNYIYIKLLMLFYSYSLKKLFSFYFWFRITFITLSWSSQILSSLISILPIIPSNEFLSLMLKFSSLDIQYRPFYIFHTLTLFLNIWKFYYILLYLF